MAEFRPKLSKVRTRSLSDFSQNWIKYADWMADCGDCLPLFVKDKIRYNSFKAQEFAGLLKNGIALCKLLCYLVLDGISLCDINYENSRDGSILNLELFLEICRKNEHLNISDTDFFNPEEFYESDDIDQLIPIFSALHEFSKQRLRRQSESNVSMNCSLDIFESIDEDEEYTSPFAILKIENDSTDVYETIMGKRSSSDLDTKKFFPKSLSKHDYVLQELIGTEEKFLKHLEKINQDFLVPLTRIITVFDGCCIKINFEELYDLHKAFYGNLLVACDGSHGRTFRICSVFDDFETQFIKDYSDYLCGLQKALKKITDLGEKQGTFRKTLQECLARSEYGSFKLDGLFLFPFQRISKYHLLLKELYKNYSANEIKKAPIQHTWEIMKSVLDYLNEVERDQNEILKIETKAREYSNIDLPSGIDNFKDLARFIADERIKIKQNNVEMPSKFSGIILLFEKGLLILRSTKFKSASFFDFIKIEDIELESNDFHQNFINQAGRSMSLVSQNSKDSDFSENFINIINKKGNTLNSYTFYFPDEVKKNHWLQLFDGHKFNYRLNRNHMFNLSNFGFEVEKCDVCKKYLNGIFYQGYKCRYCGLKTHKVCAQNTNDCPKNHKNLREDALACITEKFSKNVEAEILHNTYFVVNRVDDEPKQRQGELCLNKGDFVKANKKIDGKYYYGYKLKYYGHDLKDDFKKEEGYIPSQLVDQVDLEKCYDFYPWFLEAEREHAVSIVNKILSGPNIDLNKTLFIVRSNNTGMALTYHYKDSTRHIRIKTSMLSENKLSPFKFEINFSDSNNKAVIVYYKEIATENSKQPEGKKSLYYSIDKRYFLNLIDMVNFYMNNSLKEYFGTEDTKLDIPFKYL